MASCVLISILSSECKDDHCQTKKNYVENKFQKVSIIPPKL